MLKSSLCGYNDTYIHVKGTLPIRNTGTAAVPKNRKKNCIINCATFTDCISKISNTQVDNAKDIDEVIPVNNLIEHSDIYFKTS